MIRPALLSLLVALALADAAWAQAPVPTRALRAGHLIGPHDLAIAAQPAPPGHLTDLAEGLGMEAAVTLYPNRPIPRAALAPPALVERNALVTLIFRANGLDIRAEGRALGRGAADQPVRVMNLASRTTVSGRVTAPGEVTVP